MEYKPTIEDLQELGFSNEKSTGDDHYILEVAEVSSVGFRFPQLMNYFVEQNVFLLGAVFYFVPNSFDELKVIVNAFSTNVPKSI